jgi:hypothetical protein
MLLNIAITLFLTQSVPSRPSDISACVRDLLVGGCDADEPRDLRFVRELRLAFETVPVAEPWNEFHV